MQKIAICPYFETSSMSAAQSVLADLITPLLASSQPLFSNYRALVSALYSAPVSGQVSIDIYLARVLPRLWKQMTILEGILIFSSYQWAFLNVRQICAQSQLPQSSNAPFARHFLHLEMTSDRRLKPWTFLYWTLLNSTVRYKPWFCSGSTMLVGGPVRKASAHVTMEHNRSLWKVCHEYSE